MKVFKFGGASVKDAASVRNVSGVMKRYLGEDIAVVVSAMGKSTNALEKIVEAWFYKKQDAGELLSELLNFHYSIIDELFGTDAKMIRQEVDKSAGSIRKVLDSVPEGDFDQHYDAIVSQGEIFSTLIVSAYLNKDGVKNTWLDAREIISTDSTWRDAKVDWGRINFPNGSGIRITQGFIGRTADGVTTTLGREGSDYTAAILAYASNAESVTIWKDVPGVMNADPKWFDATQLIPQMSYQDAIELAYYGATVIHPKTIKPLQNKNIPLYVRSFINPNAPGTLINNQDSPLPVPCFIFKIDQILLSISPKDFSFIVEENFSDIFECFAKHRVKIHVMQNSAISFSVCCDHDRKKLPMLLDDLKKDFKVLYNDQLELITIRYYDQATIDRVCLGKKIFLEHKSRYTVQLVVKDL